MPDKRDERYQRMQSFALRNPLVRGGALAPAHFDTDRHGNALAVAVIKDHAQFNGMPVWMASYQREARGRPLAYCWWSIAEREYAEQLLLRALKGRGSESRERLFHTNQTLVLVRAVNGKEWESFSVPFHDADPIVTDGGPAVVLRENYHSRPAAYPCENPLVAPGTLARESQPIDCGRCEPCVDRAKMETERQRLRREKEERERAEREYRAFLDSDEGKAWLAEQQRKVWE